MFWRVPSYSQASPLEGILDKQKFTLEELLDEEDLIQECKALNGRLLNFLLQPSSIEQLITYLTAQPPLPPGIEEAEIQKRRSKFPFAACEVFCCEVDALFNTLFSSEDLMAKLFSIVDTDQMPEVTLSGYFARVVKVLLVKRNTDMMSYLYNHQQVLSQLAKHLETTSMAEVVVFIVGAAEFSANYTASDSLNWLKQTNLTQEVLSQMRAGNAKDAQKNAAAVLAAIARSQISPLLSNMSNASFLEQLTEYAFNSEPQVACQALDVCIALLSPKQPQHNSYSSPGNSGVPSPPTSPPADNEADRHLKDVTVDSISAYINTLSDSLDVSDTSRSLETPFGMLKPPLGSLRLKLVELLSTMLRLGNSAAENCIIQAGAAKKALHLQLQFPFNNLLHTQVTSLILHALDNGTPAIVQHLFGECDLLGWINGAPAKVQPTPREGDERGVSRGAIRAGYLGHLVLLGNSLLEASSRRPVIEAALQASKDWQNYSQGPLAEANRRQDVMAWACGRPSKETLSTFKSTDDIIIDETEAAEDEGAVNRHLMRYNSLEDDDNDAGAPADKDFSEAADTLGSMNLSEGWSSLSLRSRHSESGAQSAERRDNRGNEFEASRSGFGQRDGSDDDEEEQFPSAQDSSCDEQAHEVNLDVSHFLSRLLSPPKESGIDDDVMVMTEDFDDFMDEDAVVIPGQPKTAGKRSGGDNSWSAFDDLATERSSKPNSADSSQRPESRPSGQQSSGQQGHSSTAPSASGEGWAPFGADSNAFQSEPSAFGEAPAAFQNGPPAFGEGNAAFQTDPSASREGTATGQSQQGETQPSGHDSRQAPSESWAAFDQSDAAAASEGQAADSSQQSNHEPVSAEVQSQQVDERPLPNADFGESNFWKPHPLALVDDVE